MLAVIIVVKWEKNGKSSKQHPSVGLPHPRRGSQKYRQRSRCQVSEECSLENRPQLFQAMVERKRIRITHPSSPINWQILQAVNWDRYPVVHWSPQRIQKPYGCMGDASGNSHQRKQPGLEHHPHPWHGSRYPGIIGRHCLRYHRQVRAKCCSKQYPRSWREQGSAASAINHRAADAVGTCWGEWETEYLHKWDWGWLGERKGVEAKSDQPEKRLLVLAANA